MSAKSRTIDAHTAEPEPPQKLAVRDRTAEKRIAKGKQALRLGQLLDDRNTGKLGDEVIKIAQAMLLCTLPYSATKENHITRTARLGDGSTLTVTFSTGIPDVPLPFGSDRKLLAWVFDRAIMGYGNDSVQNGPFGLMRLRRPV
jgi:hypothetical protein